MRRVRLALLSVVLLPIGPPAHHPDSYQTLWTALRGTLVYADPVARADVLTRLPGNLTLRVALDNAVSGWGRISLWNALPGWVPLSNMSPGPVGGSVYLAPTGPKRPAPRHLPLAFNGAGMIRYPAFLRTAPSFAATHLGRLPISTTLTIDGWSTDGNGAAWYHATTGDLSGWVYGDAVTFIRPPASDPAVPLTPFEGKSMWLTYALMQNSSPEAVVAAAQAAGLTHLYVEVAESGHGFYGRAGLDKLLPLAHHAGLYIIAWIYPYLYDLPTDVAISVAAARYVAPSGDRVDGLMADVETNMDEGAVRAYGQILRAILGPDEPMAIATFPPQLEPGKTYPFSTVALSWDVIAPMDYWHLRRRQYTAQEAYDYVLQSIQTIRDKTSPTQPIEVIGQTFDFYDSGVNSPSAAEVAACAQAARDSGAIGVGFFEWNHTTSEEWNAVAALTP